VPGSYIAVAEYDDVADSYPNMKWSHSQIVDEMTVHRDGHGDVFQVEITLLEGNSGNRVRDDRRYDDLLTVTPQGSGWSHHFAGDDGVLGTFDFDVTTIDPATVMAVGGAQPVAPLRWAYEDVATPFIGGSGGCHERGGDGIMDLTLKYAAREVTEALDLFDHGGEEIPLLLYGTLLDGTMIQGEDWLRVLDK